MNNAIYCSTGCLICRQNNYDFNLIPRLRGKIHCSAFEFMMLTDYYRRMNEIAAVIEREGLSFPVFHTDKEIGVLLSGPDEALSTENATEMYKRNCEFATEIGSKQLVLHLWGGFGSDRHIERNLRVCGTFIDIAAAAGLELLIENIPCALQTPLAHWAVLTEEYPSLRFVFDTRFAAFHGQLYDVAGGTFMKTARIAHMHISDFAGSPMDFSKLHPILHPRDGIIDFERYFNSVRECYNGTVTLESPVFDAHSPDIDKLNSSLDFIADSLKNKNQQGGAERCSATKQ